MKKLFSIITITAVVAVVMVSCKSNPATTQVIFADTTGLAQFQSWKAMNEAQATSSVHNKAVKRTSYSNKNGSMTSSTTNEAKVVKKKGWSKAAKYAAIGGGAGIIGGAVINKRNRVAGGAIGGAVLGGLGYVIGRSQDKKDGRN